MMNEEELAQLHLAVAKAEGYADKQGRYFVGHTEFQPSHNWNYAMWLMEKYGISLMCNWQNSEFCGPDGHEWEAYQYGSPVRKCYGETACIAIFRAVIAIKGAK